MRHIAIIIAFASVLSVSVLDLSGTETVDTAKVLNEVVVTGTNSGVPQKLLPYTVSVIGSRQLEATGQTQVLSAISGMVPSLFVSQRSIYGSQRHTAICIPRWKISPVHQKINISSAWNGSRGNSSSSEPTSRALADCMWRKE